MYQTGSSTIDLGSSIFFKINLQQKRNLKYPPTTKSPTLFQGPPILGYVPLKYVWPSNPETSTYPRAPQPPCPRPRCHPTSF